MSQDRMSQLRHKWPTCDDMSPSHCWCRSQLRSRWPKNIKKERFEWMQSVLLTLLMSQLRSRHNLSTWMFTDETSSCQFLFILKYFHYEILLILLKQFQNKFQINIERWVIVIPLLSHATSKVGTKMTKSMLNLITWQSSLYSSCYIWLK